MRDVKSPAGSVRADRAGLTRLRIEAAARVLFGRNGYAATTLRAIAAQAGVAVQTVYAVYGSKAGILHALRETVRLDPAAAGAYADAIGATTVPQALAAFARSIRLRWEHGADIVAMQADAAAADPGIRPEVEAVLDVRRRGIDQLAGSIAALDPALGNPGPISAGIDALTLPEVYAELTAIHGWTSDQYEAWLAHALIATITG